MKSENLPSLPFGTEIKQAYYLSKNYIHLVGEKDEFVLVATWDGISSSYNEINVYPKVEFLK